MEAMSLPGQAAILLAGVAAGVAGTVASLASVISYPALLAAGLSPLGANVTNTAALTFKAIGAGWGARRELSGQERRIVRLGALTAVGGAVGAALLLMMPPEAFQMAAPVLVALACLALLLPHGRPACGRRRRKATRYGVFGVAVYTGYFGAAGGVLLLAALDTVFDDDLADLNALKNALAGISNLVATLAFALYGPVEWSLMPALAAGFLLGGRIGPVLVRKLPAGPLRVLIASGGIGVAVHLGIDAYGL
ncbi:sulfite exporter TauE/SafE family protein [Spirillospora sp. NPDC127200]